MAERYMYDFSEEILKLHKVNEKVDIQTIEKFLSITVDGYWKNIIVNIVNNFQWFSLKYSYHYLDVYRCITMQLLRTPYGKRGLAHVYSEVYNKDIIEDFENILLAKELFNVIDDNMKSVLLESILNEFGHICIGINDTNIPFITSDNPVITLPNIWKKNEEMIFYPITPTRCIMLFKRNIVDSQLSNVMQEFANGNFKIKEFSDIPQEAYKREKELIAKLNPEKKALDLVDVLTLNTYCYTESKKYIVSSVDIKSNKLWTEIDI